MLRVYPADGGRNARAGLLFVVPARRGMVRAGCEGCSRLSQPGWSWLTRGGEHEAVTPGPAELPASGRLRGPRGACAPGALLRRVVSRPQPQATCEYGRGPGRGSGWRCGVRCALPAPPSPIHAASVMEVSDEAQSAQQSPDLASRAGNVPPPDLSAGGGRDRPWPRPAGAAGALRAASLSVTAEDA